MENSGNIKSVTSTCENLEKLFISNKFKVDFYQREYVWSKNNIEDLIRDLTGEFLKNYKPDHTTTDIKKYNPYFMGGVVIAKSIDSTDLVDGQQRITSLTLLLIYLKNRYGKIQGFPSKVSDLIFSDDCGEKKFNIDVTERIECLKSLNENGDYLVREDDDSSVKNITERYNDIREIWEESIEPDKISSERGNINHFVYWMMNNIIFSKIETNSDEFAYVIFESMNDRGCSLSQTDMLRSYLLANIKDKNKRNVKQELLDNKLDELKLIKASKKTRIDIEFFRNFLRSLYAINLSPDDDKSDYNRIGREFHRWVSDNTSLLKLKNDDDYCSFVDTIVKYINCYIKINGIITNRKTEEYLYLVSNNDLEFTLQYPLLIAGISFSDDDAVIEQKIKLISKFISKYLLFRIWNGKSINQSTVDVPIFKLCKQIRAKNPNELNKILSEYDEMPSLEGVPILNGQNKRKLKVMIAVITEIISKNIGEHDYLLNKKNMEVEHIWADHYELHRDEFDKEEDYRIKRNTIGGLLILPKTFNASYGDEPYKIKVKYYFRENILAKTLNKETYSHYPKLIEFIKNSKLNIVGYDAFNRAELDSRSLLYKSILEYNYKGL